MPIDGWIKDAVCRNDEHSLYWTSSDWEQIEYAKEKCTKCDVKIPCIVTALEDPYFAGVTAGMSKFDRLILLHRRVENASEKGWIGPDSLIERIVEQGQ